MKIKILCVGKLKEKFFKDAVDEYLKRMLKFADVEIIEVPDEKTDEKAGPNDVKIVLSKEGERLMKHIKESDHVITLDIKGKKLDSPGLASYIGNTINQGKSSIAFVIGGSWGLSDSIKNRSDLALSFSDMTFPHQLMRVILLEQIYRAFKINANEPYHK